MPNELKNRLKELRQEKFLSQNSLAASLGLPRGTYTHYELGKRMPDLELLMKIADFYQVSLDYLTGYTAIRPETAVWLAGHPERSGAGAVPADYWPQPDEAGSESRQMIAETPAKMDD